MSNRFRLGVADIEQQSANLTEEQLAHEEGQWRIEADRYAEARHLVQTSRLYNDEERADVLCALGESADEFNANPLAVRVTVCQSLDAAVMADIFGV